MAHTIALADDFIAIRKAMALLIESITDLKVVLEASDGSELLELLTDITELPQVCLLNLSMKGMDGFETLKFLKRSFPTVKVIIYSMHLDEYNLLQSYKLGAYGAITKESTPDVVKEAIEEVQKGNYYIPPTVSKSVRKMIEEHSIKIPLLTDREKEFLKLYCEDQPYSVIATHLKVSEKTVDNHRENVCKKLGIRGKIGLALFAIKIGLIHWP